MDASVTRFGKQKVWIALFAAVGAVVFALVAVAARNVRKNLTKSNEGE